jgi:prolyl-tRNA editing enzyme YbaK/EbsC (Cys-tRNA(Pro) deacylase)
VHPSAKKVQQAIDQLGFSCQVVEMPETTRSAKEAAQAIGCTVQQIAKSLVFRGKVSGSPILVIASGTNRVNERLLAGYVGEAIERADADFVREQTGFVIGGVPPVGHSKPVRTFLDRDLLQYESIWAAAGTPNAVFQLTPADLKSMTAGEVVPIT